jgi:hypothetical protein
MELGFGDILMPDKYAAMGGLERLKNGVCGVCGFVNTKRFSEKVDEYRDEFGAQSRYYFECWSCGSEIDQWALGG